MNDHRESLKYRKLSKTRMPVESVGPCKSCDTVGTLGDGICDQCWDKKGYRRVIQEMTYKKEKPDQKQV